MRWFTLLDWPRALQDLHEVLPLVSEGGDTFRLVPCIQGVPVHQCGVRRISSLWPDANLGEWENILTPSFASPLSDALELAVDSLVTISGISVLSASQQMHPEVARIRTNAQNMLNSARADLSILGSVPEAVARLIGNLSTRLDKEGQSSVKRGDLFLSIWSARENPDSIGTALVLARLLALEWDLDPALAQSDLVKMEFDLDPK